jgi:hypothetical protein
VTGKPEFAIPRWTVLSPATGQATVWAATRAGAERWADRLRDRERSG